MTRHASDDNAFSSAVITDTIVRFINDVGICCIPQALAPGTFLPGIDIRSGSIFYDLALMSYPGDLLHEAGHLAVLLPHDRMMATSPDMISGDLQEAGAEMAAIAWSWAALHHLGLPPEVVFHPHGYKGASENLIQNFSEGRFVGVPLLHWMDMTNNPGMPAHSGGELFPAMKRWLR